MRILSCLSLFVVCSAAMARPPETEQQVADRLLLALSAHADTAVSITSGTEHFRKGLVVLTLRGSGEVEVLNRASGKVSRYSGKLPKAELDTVGVEIQKAGLTRLTTKGPPREPGDSPVVLEVHSGKTRVYSKSLWYADRHEKAGLDTILKRYEALVGRFTKGHLPY